MTSGEHKSWVERYLAGWPAALALIGSGLLSAALLVPRAVPPRELPLPLIDRNEERRREASDAELAREARAERIAHPGWLLRFANAVLARNVVLGPWIHVSSDVTMLGLVHDGERVEARDAGKLFELFLQRVRVFWRTVRQGPQAAQGLTERAHSVRQGLGPRFPRELRFAQLSPPFLVAIDPW